MAVELLHFREADKLLQSIGMEKEVKLTMEYLEMSFHRAESPKGVLNKSLFDMGWRENLEALKIIDGRRYSYRGFKSGIGFEANLSSYEYLQQGLFRLQLGYDKGLITMGIVAITGERSANSKLGTSSSLVTLEVEDLFPTISLPVSVALFNPA